LIEINARGCGKIDKSRSMTQIKLIEQRLHPADRLRRRWPLLCLLAAIATLLSLGQPMQAQALSPEFQYVMSATSGDLGCDDAHALSGHHCCAGTACSASAQFEATSASPRHMTCVHPLPSVARIRVGLSLRPDLQPPQHSSHA
jgi:hypothetical protein